MIDAAKSRSLKSCTMEEDMRTLATTISLTMSALLLISGSAAANEQALDKYIDDHNKFAQASYFANMKAFTFFENRGQRSGDTIFIPNLAQPTFLLNPSREKCFPSFSGGRLLPQNIFSRPTYQRVLDIGGLIGAAVPALAKAEIQGKMELQQEISENIKLVKMETASVDQLLSSFDANACPELNSIIKAKSGTGNYIPIYEVYFAEGTIEIRYKLKLTGAFSAGTQNSATSLLQKLNLATPSLEAKADGKYETVTQSVFNFNIDNPVAFRPLFVDQDHVAWVYENYLKTGILKKIAENINDDRAIRKLISEDQQLEELAQYAGVFGPFAKGRNLVPYDPNNRTHQDYVELNTYLVAIANITPPRTSAN